MGSSEEFCLRWNDFESNISTAFRHLRNDNDFFDVNLGCYDNSGDGDSSPHRTLKAHKVILSSCSPYFRSMLRQLQNSGGNQVPFIVMRGVSIQQLSGILDFMYYGEANIAQDELDAFLALAEELQVKGLTQSKGTSTSENKKRPSTVSSQTPHKKLKPSPSPALKSDSNEQIKIESEVIESEFEAPGGLQGSDQAEGYIDNYGQVDIAGGYDDPGEGTSSYTEEDKGETSTLTCLFVSIFVCYKMHFKILDLSNHL